jgi:hypothetical protein
VCRFTECVLRGNRVRQPPERRLVLRPGDAQLKPAEKTA